MRSIECEIMLLLTAISEVLGWGGKKKRKKKKNSHYQNKIVCDSLKIKKNGKMERSVLLPFL